MLWLGLHDLEADDHFLQATASDCFPTLHHGSTELPRCSNLMDEMLEDFLPHHPGITVLLAARWKPGMLPNLTATIDWLKEHRVDVVLIGPVAAYDSLLPQLMVRALRTSTPDLPQQHLDRSQMTLDTEMSRLAADHGIPYVSLIALECPGSSCMTQDPQGRPLLFDQEHFTDDGSRAIGRRLMDTDGVIAGALRSHIAATHGAGGG